MKITDEVKTFHGADGEVFEVSSNSYGTHETPSTYLHVDDGEGHSVGFGTFDTNQIKEIIQHMAKMAGLNVTITDADAAEPVVFTPKFQKGDRVRSLMPDEFGQLGTVCHDKPHAHGWNVRVLLDDHSTTGLFMHHELEPVSGE